MSSARQRLLARGIIMVGILLIAGYSARGWLRAEAVPHVVRSIVADALQHAATDNAAALEASGLRGNYLRTEPVSCGRSLADRLHIEVTCESYAEGVVWTGEAGTEQIADAMAHHGWQILDVDPVDGQIGASRTIGHTHCLVVLDPENGDNAKRANAVPVRQVCTRVVSVL